MKAILITLATTLVLMSCGSDSDMPGTTPGDGNNGDSVISQEDFDALAAPCADESNTITLPTPMTIMSNYIQYEATVEIFSAQQFSQNLLAGLSTPLLPPPSAIYSDVDNITVFQGDNAYDWKVGEDTYRYILKDNGYEIRFFKDSDLIGTGRQLVFVEQSADCTDFEYIQYAIENDGDVMIGDNVFRYVYQRAGTATLIKFGTDLSSEDSEEYDMRSFDDLSGDMSVRVNGQTVRRYNWQSDGSGSFDLLENLMVVESGTWTF